MNFALQIGRPNFGKLVCDVNAHDSRFENIDRTSLIISSNKKVPSVIFRKEKKSFVKKAGILSHNVSAR